jgi:hypothetical protein
MSEDKGVNATREEEAIERLLRMIRQTRDPETSAAIARNAAERERIPVDEALERLKVTPAVAARIRRLNPTGILPYTIIRGMHRKVSNGRRINMDVCGPKEFIKRYGREAYREHASAFRHDGHRKYVTREYVQDRVAHFPAKRLNHIH